jgi:hypothetical protein
MSTATTSRRSGQQGRRTRCRLERRCLSAEFALKGASRLLTEGRWCALSARAC